MPTPSKFTQNRKERILQVLRAGGSRRQAALAGEIDQTTLGRWLERGRSSAPDGRWARFRREVLEAEGQPASLQVLRDRFEVQMGDAGSAWQFLQELDRRERAPAPSGPVSVTVTFSPTTAKGDPA